MGENYITCREANGSINISEDVIADMVRNAIVEVEFPIFWGSVRLPRA